MSRSRFTDWLIKFQRDDSGTGALAKGIRAAMRADASFPRDPHAEEEIRAHADQIGPAISALPEAWARWLRETGRDRPVPEPAGIPAAQLALAGMPAAVLGVHPSGTYRAIPLQAELEPEPAELTEPDAADSDKRWTEGEIREAVLAALPGDHDAAGRVLAVLR